MAGALLPIAMSVLPSLLGGGSSAGASAGAGSSPAINFSQQQGQALQKQMEANAKNAKTMVDALGGGKDDKDDDSDSTPSLKV